MEARPSEPESDGFLRPNPSVGDWQSLHSRDADRAMLYLRRELVASVEGTRGRLDAEDIAHSVLIRALSPGKCFPCGWPSDVPFLVWIRGIARKAVAEWTRDRCAHPSLLPLPESLAGATAIDHRVADLRMDFHAFASRLPPPHSWIVRWRLEGATRQEIAANLHALRGIGPDESRRLIRETLRMMRTLLEEGYVELRERWPTKFRSDKNPWLTTPPSFSQ